MVNKWCPTWNGGATTSACLSKRVPTTPKPPKRMKGDTTTVSTLYEALMPLSCQHSLPSNVLPCWFASVCIQAWPIRGRTGFLHHPSRCFAFFERCMRGKSCSGLHQGCALLLPMSQCPQGPASSFFPLLKRYIFCGMYFEHGIPQMLSATKTRAALFPPGAGRTPARGATRPG